MNTRAVHDPFLNKTVEVSDNLTDRLRGRYAVGPTLPNGEPEFGWQQHPAPPIQHEAAAEIERQQWINRKLFTALKDMAEFWRYGMANPDGARPTAEDEARVEKLAKDALDALVAASPDYLSTLPPL
jgi:hypothetical protein